MLLDHFVSSITSPHSTDSLDGVLPPFFSISECGPYSLRHHIDLPGSQIGGELLLSLNELSVTPVSLASVESGFDKRQLKVTLNPAALKGRYELFCLENPRVTMDTGGLLGRLPSTNGEAPPEWTEERYFRFVQLEQERANLNETANGRELVGRYNEHNDAYHDVFTQNEQLRKHWEEDGATEEMGIYTSAALKNGSVINPADRGFGSKNASYNSTSFAQSLYLYFACMGGGFEEAGIAALTFKDMIETETGNTDSETVGLTRSQVYATVNNASRRSRVEGPNAKTLALHSAFSKIVTQETVTDHDIDFFARNGYVMDPETHQRLKAIYQAGVRQRDPKQRIEVSSANFEVNLAQSEFDYVLTEQPDGALTVKLRATTLRIPELPLCTGPASDANTCFIRGLLIDRISSQLTRYLRALARREG